MKVSEKAWTHGEFLPGVVMANNLAEWLWDEVYNNGINLTENEWRIALEKENGRDPEYEDWDRYEEEEPTYLLGGWYDVHEKGGGVNWVPVSGSEYSAILQWLGGAPLVTVVAGKFTTTVTSMCGPCCPNQADLDSGYKEGGYECYSLPVEFYQKENES